MSENKKKTKTTPKKETVVKKEEKTNEFYNLLDNDSNHLILKTISLILVILVGVFAVYKFVISDTRFIVSSNITKTYELLANNIIRLSKSEIFNSKYNLTGVLSFNTTDKKYKDLNDNLYAINLNIDKDNNNYDFNLNIDNMLDASYLISNNNTFLKLNNIYDNTIKIDESIINYDQNINNLFKKIDLNKLNNSAKQIKNIINKYIDNKYITKEKNNDNTTLIITLTKEEYSTILSKIIDEAKDNDSLINNLSSSFNISKEDTINYLDTIVKNNLNNNINELKIKIYTEGLFYKTTSYELLIDNKQVFNINLNDYTFKYDYNNLTIDFYKEDKYKAIINNNIKLTFNELDYNTIDIDYTNDNNYGNIHFSKYNKQENKSGNISYSLVTKDNKTSFNFDYRFENFNQINLNNIIDYKDISEEDYLNIVNNINNQVKIKTINKYLTETLEKINK